MSQLSQSSRFRACAWATALVCLTMNSFASPSTDDTRPTGQQGMAHMSGHMYMTSLRPLKAGDQQKADAVAAAAKQAMAPYQDYRKALADGYEIFLPNVPQSQYHFTKHEYGREAWLHFDPLKPTSLLYRKTADGDYKLIGAMYTDRVDATEDELNDRIPLSIAHWHQHINFCKAPPDQKALYFGPNAKWLEKFLVMPRYHHWHHTSQKEGIDKNFAIHFPWIDRLFGTYYYPAEWPQQYGLDSEEIAPDFFRQTIDPFTKKRKSA